MEIGKTSRQEEGRRQAAYTKSSRTRSALVAAAMELGRGPVSDLTVRRVASSAKVSVPTFYKHFESISNLCQHVLFLETDKLFEIDPFDLPKFTREYLERGYRVVVSVIREFPSLVLKAGLICFANFLDQVMFRYEWQFKDVDFKYLYDARWHSYAAAAMIFAEYETAIIHYSENPSDYINTHSAIEPMTKYVDVLTELDSKIRLGIDGEA